jgi:hypothetical protein
MHVDETLLESMAQKRVLRLSRVLKDDLRELYPKRCKTMGDNHLSEFTNRCALDAFKYGCNNYGELKAYIFLALFLGIKFADDPLYPWVSETLMRQEPFSLKIESMSETFFKYHFIGEKESLQSYKKALEALLKVNFKYISGFKTYSEIALGLEKIYPERMKLLGGVEKVSVLLNLATSDKIKQYKLEHPISIFIYASLVFFLGSGVDDDPQYHWVRKYLNSNEKNMAVKVDTLVKVIRKRVRNEIRSIDMISVKEENG